jgi:hypothetical protein
MTIVDCVFNIYPDQVEIRIGDDLSFWDSLQLAAGTVIAVTEHFKLPHPVTPQFFGPIQLQQYLSARGVLCVSNNLQEKD